MRGLRLKMGAGLCALGLGLTWTAGCQEPEVAAPQSIPEAIAAETAPKEVIATVNGHPISAALVRRLAKAQKRPAAEILDELITAQLLYGKAIEAGYAKDDEMLFAHKQLMVQRLLAKGIEEPFSEEKIPASVIKDYYKANEPLYYDPPLRSAVHLLVKPNSERWKPGEQAPAEVMAAASKLSAAIKDDIAKRNESIKDKAGFDAVMARWADKCPPELELKVEVLSQFPRREFGKPEQPGYRPTMVEPFAKAAFEAPVGVLTGPVQTQFGQHLLVVTSTTPENRITIKSAEPGIREFLAGRERQVQAQAFLQGLMSKSELAIDDSLLAKLQADSEKSEKAAPKP